MHINYQELVDNYQKNLDGKLRGFTGGQGFLETWTYDVDETRSIQSIIDLADESGVHVLNIEMPNGVIHQRISEKAAALDALLNDCLIKLGCETVVTIVDMHDDIVVLDYEETDQKTHTYFIRLEAMVYDLTKERINIQTLNMDDKNKRQCR